VKGVYVTGGKIYAATTGGLSISTDGGETFNNRLEGGVNGVYVRDGIIYAASESGVEISTDGGASWVQRLGRYATGVYVDESGTIYAGTSQVQKGIVGEQILGLPKDAPPQGSCVVVFDSQAEKVIDALLCRDEAACGLRAILADTHEAVLAILEKRTLAEALARADLVSSEAGIFGQDVFAGAFI
jgi:hypothetical protein